MDSDAIAKPKMVAPTIPIEKTRTPKATDSVAFSVRSIALNDPR
jgi:hypothetical protein